MAREQELSKATPRGGNLLLRVPEAVRTSSVISCLAAVC